MCGIFGQIGMRRAAGRFATRDRFTDALHLQSHRGPDDWGVTFTDRYSFGHRRLSIIDLDAKAKQPMTTADGRFTVVFNGEIYNYRELRQDLASRGVEFRTKGDTEVLLYGIQCYGIAFVEKCIGMFAFALYDQPNDTFYLVRDRLGIKPLYYTVKSETLTFSSEIKSILRVLDEPAQLNVQAVSSYLSFRHPIGEESYFEGILSLKPGHYLEVNGRGDTRLKEYWNPVGAFAEQEHDKGEAFYLERLDEIFRSAVQYRMVADVPVGAYLSGGVDSSLVVACMARLAGPAVKTFTVGFAEEGYNEFAWAQMVADQYGTDHTEILLSADKYIETMEKLVWYKDAPLSVPNEVSLYEMSRELKKHITVVLSGEGADEIFGGYGRIFRSCFDYQRLKDGSFDGASLNERQEFLDNFFKKYRTDAFGSELDHFLSIYSYTSSEDKCDLMSADIPWRGLDAQLGDHFSGWFEQLKGHSYENKMMYAFERVHLLGLLHRVDMTTMATAVEARVPFVDHRLVEFAFTVPSSYKLRWNSQADFAASRCLMSDRISEVHDTPKYILKKASEKYLPRDLIYRKKMGFPVPLNDWFGGRFNSYARDHLLSSKARNRGLYNIAKVEQWLDSDMLSQSHPFALKIWMLVNVELFMQRYFDQAA